MALGGIVAAVGALAAVLVAVDSKAKELNRTLLEGGATAGEINQAFGTLGGGLDKLRKQATEFGFNALWGTTAKDTLEIWGAFGKAGVTLKELGESAGKGREQMAALRDATAATLTYARLLGTTNVEMAEVFAERMQELGLGINGVAESLSAVHAAALESGFGVKRFFNMVLQATSGMTMYNVRMEEAAGLLLRMGKILGVKAGGEFVQSLTKGFGDLSTQEKHKKVMLIGAKTTKETYGISARNTAEDFVKKVAEKGVGKEMSAAIAKAGIKIDMSDAKGLVKTLGGLSTAQQTKLLARARESGGDELTQQLTNLIGVSQGAKGGMGRMAMNLGSLDMGGKLMMMIQQKVKGKSVHDLDEVQTMAMENMYNVSGEQLAELKRVSQVLAGSHQTLLEQLKSGKQQTEAEKIASVKAHGAFIENGEIIAAHMDAAGEKIDEGSKKAIGTSYGEYVQQQSAAFKDAMEAGVPADTLLAQEQVARTTELTQRIQNGVDKWLEEIHGVVEGILNWIMGADGRKSRSTALEGFAKAETDSREKIRTQTKILADLQASLKTAKTPADKAAIREKITEESLKLNRAQSGLQLASAQRKSVLTNPDAMSLLGPSKTAGQLGGEALQTPEAQALLAKGRGQYDPDLAIQVQSRMIQKYVDNVMKARFGTSSHEDFMEKKPNLIQQDEWDALQERARALGGTVTKTAIAGGTPAIVKQYAKDHFWGPDIHRVPGKRASVPYSFQGKGQEALEAGLKTDFSDDLEDLSKQEAKLELKAEKADKKLLGKGGENPAEIAKKLDPVLNDALDRQAQATAATNLMNTLYEAGIYEDPMKVAGWSKNLSENIMPPELKGLLSKEIKGAEGTPSTTVEKSLRGKGVRIPIASPKAEDFLMHIDSDGQVKFAQRIDGADTVAVATKTGGAVDRASGGGGAGGGTTIVQHNYSSMDSVVKGWRTLMASRAMG